MTGKTVRLAPGRYLHAASGVEIVRVDSETRGYRGGWVTRNADDPRETFDWYGTCWEAVEALDEWEA